MTYRAKSLPPWVRFRPRPRAKPVYTVPTLNEWRIQRMVDATMASYSGRLAKQVTQNSALLAYVTQRAKEGTP